MYLASGLMDIVRLYKKKMVSGLFGFLYSKAMFFLRKGVTITLSEATSSCSSVTLHLGFKKSTVPTSSSGQPSSGTQARASGIGSGQVQVCLETRVRLSPACLSDLMKHESALPAPL